MPSTEAPPQRHATAMDHSPSQDTELTSLSLVQIAERLDRITTQIEAERSRERDARARYREVADQVEARILDIKATAAALIREQQRRMASFDGLLGAAAPRDPVPTGASRRAAVPATPSNISDAIVAIWSLPEYDQPLTTEEIADALPAVGYESKAAPRSLRSAVNQALAKLCRDGRIQKYRQDGSLIDTRDRKARARKYMTSV